MSETPLGKGSLVRRLLAVCLALYVAVAAIATTVEVVQLVDQTNRAVDQEIDSLAGTFSLPLATALWNFDKTQVQVLVRVLSEIPSVGRVHLVTSEGEEYLGGDEAASEPLGPVKGFDIRHDRDGRGVLVGRLSLQASLAVLGDQVVDTLVRAAIRTGIVVLFLSAVLVVVAWRMVGRPLRQLATRIEAIDPRAGDLGTLEPPRRGGTELAAVTQAFNALLQELQTVKASLESVVAARTVHLEKAVEELTSTRDSLVSSSKMAVLGQLVAGVAHDLNTPLGAALSASNSALQVLREIFEEAKKDEAFATIAAQITDPWALDRVGTTRPSRALRRLVADAGVENVDEVMALMDEVDFAPGQTQWLGLLATSEGQEALVRVQRMVVLIRSCRIVGLSSEKMAQVVENLLRYSRHETASAPVPVDLVAELESILMLFTSALKTGVKLVRKLGPVGPISGRPDRLQLVWTNLITNAVQALEGHGTLEIIVKASGAWVEVTVANDGPVIPEDIASKLFTPFFTTKPRGVGTGLGLSICQRVVEEHQGTIDVQSRPGRTQFVVRLPKAQGGEV